MKGGDVSFFHGVHLLRKKGNTTPWRGEMFPARVERKGPSAQKRTEGPAPCRSTCGRCTRHPLHVRALDTPERLRLALPQQSEGPARRYRGQRLTLAQPRG